jgi:hypothetical protein
MSGWPVGRPSGWHPVDGRRTAIRPPVARSDCRLDGGRPLHPSVGVAVGRPADGRADGLADPFQNGISRLNRTSRSIVMGL